MWSTAIHERSTVWCWSLLMEPTITNEKPFVISSVNSFDLCIINLVVLCLNMRTVENMFSIHQAIDLGISWHGYTVLTFAWCALCLYTVSDSFFLILGLGPGTPSTWQMETPWMLFMTWFGEYNFPFSMLLCAEIECHCSALEQQNQSGPLSEIYGQ